MLRELRAARYIHLLALHILLLCAAAEGLVPQKPSVPLKLRVIVLSNFPPLDVIPGGGGSSDPGEKRSDPDDVQSMVRFLVYANEFNVDGLVASAGTFANIARKQHILDILDLYDQVDKNLWKYDQRFHTADKLRAVTWLGRYNTWGKPTDEIIVENQDSEASEAVMDRPDSRPAWVCVWGGLRNPITSEDRSAMPAGHGVQTDRGMKEGIGMITLGACPLGGPRSRSEAPYGDNDAGAEHLEPGQPPHRAARSSTTSGTRAAGDLSQSGQRH